MNLYLRNLEYNKNKINSKELIQTEFEYKIKYNGYDEKWLRTNIEERVATTTYSAYALYKRGYDSATNNYVFVPTLTQDDVAPFQSVGTVVRPWSKNIIGFDANIIKLIKTYFFEVFKIFSPYVFDVVVLPNTEPPMVEFEFLTILDEVYIHVVKEFNDNPVYFKQRY